MADWKGTKEGMVVGEQNPECSLKQASRWGPYRAVTLKDERLVGHTRISWHQRSKIEILSKLPHLIHALLMENI
jgi:hypothetical protein